MITDKILVVDDDTDVLDAVGVLLEGAGYQVVCATNGKDMFKHLDRGMPDLIILDVNLGSESGFDLQVQIRKMSSAPIIMVSGKGAETDRVVGLELGADDYFAKPYGSAELVARVKSVLRRTKLNGAANTNGEKSVAMFDGWKCDLTRRILYSADESEISLTSGKFSLLAAFLQHPGKPLNRERLLDMTGRENTFDRSLDVMIMRLRKKIEPEMIKAVRSVGYTFSSPVEWS